MSDIDWGAALASGVAAGAGEMQDQQKQADADASWLAKQKQLMAMEVKNQQARERYMLALKPPEKQEIKTTDAAGNHIVKSQRYQAPSDADIAAGKPGDWQDVGSTPDINFDRLAETQKNNEARNALTGEAITQRGEAAAARIDAAKERLAAENARADARKGGGKDFGFTDYASATPEQRALYDRYRRGEDDPTQKADFEARKATLRDLQAMPDASPSEKANTLYQNQTLLGAKPFASVQAGEATSAPPMGQFAPGQKAAAQPAAQGKTPYTEGQIIYDKQGRKYVVRNGVPVPAP